MIELNTVEPIKSGEKLMGILDKFETFFNEK
jgi:hypothetical protein